MVQVLQCLFCTCGTALIVISLTGQSTLLAGQLTLLAGQLILLAGQLILLTG
jgi:hypothetical protein